MEFEDSIRLELAETPFEELLKIREKLGTKVYRESVLKKLRNKPNVDEEEVDEEEQEQGDDNEDQDEDSDSDLESSNLNSVPNPKPRKKQPKNHNFVRVNRGYPIESSSKRVDYRYNFSTKPIPKISNNSLKVKKRVDPNEPRDPRFDSKCGEFRQEYFDKNYSFLLKMKRDELELVRRQLRKVKNEEKRESLKSLAKRLQNQIKTEEAKQIEKERGQQIVNHQITREQEHQQQYQQQRSTPEVGSSERNMKQQKTPSVYINKSTMKRAQLVEKFKHLKENNKLDKYIERKRKKNAIKDRKLLHR